jgi:hypothetical protein
LRVDDVPFSTIVTVVTLTLALARQGAAAHVLDRPRLRPMELFSTSGRRHL